MTRTATLNQSKQSINPTVETEDGQLQQEILAELYWDPSLTAAHIGVAVNAGIVTLTGHVESFAEKYAAENAAGRIGGVKAVAEEIEVRLPFDRTRADDEISAPMRVIVLLHTGEKAVHIHKEPAQRPGRE